MKNIRKKTSIICLTLLSVLLYSTNSFAHENYGYENQKEEHHDEDEYGNEHLRAFVEGTSNIISPYTYHADTFYMNYSHNFFINSFPRGSNPAFQLSYTPIENLQIDSVISLRSAPPIEFEIGAKYRILDEFNGSPLSLTPRIAYNTRGNIFGFDISASKVLFDDILNVGASYRLLSNASADNITGVVQGIGLNAIARVWKHWHLYGDVVLPFSGNIISQKGFIWSAGIKKVLQHTPHILTIYAGNNNESTISGRTISTGNGQYPDMLKVGFVFSIVIPELSELPRKLF